MINGIKGLFYKPGTTDLHKERIVSVVVLTLVLISLLLYGRVRNKRINEERKKTAGYTIGTTINLYKNFRSPNPTVKYKFMVGGNEYSSFQEIPDSLHGKIFTEGGRYYVEFSYKQPTNCKLLLQNQVPESIKEAPTDGWDNIPLK